MKMDSTLWISCAERGLFLTNTFFQHKMIHRYAWARQNEKSLIDYIAVNNRPRREAGQAGVGVKLLVMSWAP